MNPIVSIIIPTHKRNVSTLERAVFSALNQTYKEVEVIVVDDNAGIDLETFRQSVVQRLTQIQTCDARLKIVLNNSNKGGALSRNEGVKNATGKFVTFLDDDDEFLPDKVLHQISFMKEKDVNVSFTDLSIYNEKGVLVDHRNRQELKSMDKAYLFKYHIMKNITGTETFMILKDVFNAVGGFDDVKVGHEFYLMFKLLKSPVTVFGYYPSDDIRAYRTSEESISNGPYKIQGEKENYKFKKQFFNLLKISERRYVTCRYRAVLAFSYKRRKSNFKAFYYLTLAFLTAPVTSIKEAKKHKK